MSDSDDDGANDTPEATVLREESVALELVVEAGGGPDASAALVRAAEQSRLAGIPLRIMYVWQLSDEPARPVSESFLVASAADARARATRWVHDTLGDDEAASLRWSLDLVEGTPVLTVAAAAADNELELST